MEHTSEIERWTFFCWSFALMQRFFRKQIAQSHLIKNIFLTKENA